jgi:chromosome segregation protein
MDHIQEYLTATYRIPVEDCLAQLPDAVPVETSEGTVEEPSGPAAALEPLHVELSDWKERLQRLGPVNPAAVEEFQELQTRFDFMTQQEADLTEACDTLQQTINKINQTTREMFLDAFHALNQNFQMVFQKLFREGSARLILTDESKVLESGIDIEAHPSGKTVSHLSLLSGGEKALTAIALLFGSFLVRPTPFCVLDEIDAPLDEANTGRFIEALKSMTDRSQFIVITHNKRTMEAADVLYGVTMEEPGISKVLSVQLSRETHMEPETVAA